MLKSFGLRSKEGDVSKNLAVYRWYNSVWILAKSLVFKKFYSELPTDLVKKLTVAPNKFCSSIAKDYDADIFGNRKIESQLLNVSEDVKKFRIA